MATAVGNNIRNHDDKSNLVESINNLHNSNNVESTNSFIVDSWAEIYVKEEPDEKPFVQNLYESGNLEENKNFSVGEWADVPVKAETEENNVTETLENLSEATAKSNNKKGGKNSRKHQKVIDQNNKISMQESRIKLNQQHPWITSKTLKNAKESSKDTEQNIVLNDKIYAHEHSRKLIEDSLVRQSGQDHIAHNNTISAQDSKKVLEVKNTDTNKSSEPRNDVSEENLDKYLYCTGGKFICQFCGYVTGWKNNLRKHIISRHMPSKEIAWIYCAHCPYKGKTKEYLVSHLRTKHGFFLKWYKCEHCEYKIKIKTLLDNHVMLRHTADENIKWNYCDQCLYRTVNKSALSIHIHAHHTAPDDRRWFNCEECAYKTRVNKSLKRHVLRKHTDEDKIKWFRCDKCSYKAKLKDCLNDHVKKQHMVQENRKWLYCHQCLYKAKFKRELQRHINYLHIAVKNGDSEKWLNCEHCDYNTCIAALLRKHILVKHTDEDKIKWFYCENCSYKAKHKQTLYQHNKRHAAPQHVEAPRIQKTRQIPVVKHIDEDTIKWLYCENCSYKAKHKQALYLHSKRHAAPQHVEAPRIQKTRQIPVVIDGMVTWKSIIVSPDSSLNEKDKFKCQLCEEVFNNQRLYKYHFMYHHTAKGRLLTNDKLYAPSHSDRRSPRILYRKQTNRKLSNS